jgi:hypothetical protein
MLCMYVQYLMYANTLSGVGYGFLVNIHLVAWNVVFPLNNGSLPKKINLRILYNNRYIELNSTEL